MQGGLIVPVYTFTTLDDPLATQASGGTEAFGINNAGQIVGEYNIFGHGFLYSGGTYTNIDDGTAGTGAWGINASGQIVGQFVNGSVTDGFLRSGGTFTTLIDTDPSAVSTAAHGINNRGEIVGIYRRSTTPVLKGFVFDPRFGTYATLFDPSASFNTIPYGINDAGQVVGSYDTHSFLLSGGVYTPRRSRGLGYWLHRGARYQQFGSDRRDVPGCPRPARLPL
jgi:uncharacterized membrane protein